MAVDLQNARDRVLGLVGDLESLADLLHAAQATATRELEEVKSVSESRWKRIGVLNQELAELKVAVAEMKPAADPPAQDEIERLRGELAAAEAERGSLRGQIVELHLQESLLKERVRVQDSQRVHQLERHDRILAKYREVKRESLQRGIDLEKAHRRLAAVNGPQSPAAPSEDSYLAEELAKARTDLAILVAAVASLTHAYKSSGSAAMCLWCSSSDPDAPPHRTVSRLFAEKK